MDYIRVTQSPSHNIEPLILCLSQFDGVHIGHQALLREAAKYIENELLAVMDFSVHPLWVLEGKEEYKSVLTPLKEKKQLLDKLGVNLFFDVQYSKDSKPISSQSFVDEYLSKINVKHLFISEDFSFGTELDAYTLKEQFEHKGIPVTIVPNVTIHGTKVSDLVIRQHLAEGRHDAVQVMLGRSYQITGEVVHGKALGRQLGYPTANLEESQEYVYPVPGVYMGLVEIDSDIEQINEHWYSLINAGYRPTVNGSTYKIEAFLMDYSGDLYGRVITVTFLQRLRPEMKFSGLDPLIKQMEQDTLQAKALLGLE